MNKLDSFRSGEDDIAGTIESIWEDINKLPFKNVKVCPVSAYAGGDKNALYIKAILPRISHNRLKILIIKNSALEGNLKVFGITLTHQVLRKLVNPFLKAAILHIKQATLLNRASIYLYACFDFVWIILDELI